MNTVLKLAQSYPYFGFPISENRPSQVFAPVNETNVQLAGDVSYLSLLNLKQTEVNVTFSAGQKFPLILDLANSHSAKVNFNLNFITKSGNKFLLTHGILNGQAETVLVTPDAQFGMFNTVVLLSDTAPTANSATFANLAQDDAKVSGAKAVYTIDENIINVSGTVARANINGTAANYIGLKVTAPTSLAGYSADMSNFVIDGKVVPANNVINGTPANTIYIPILQAGQVNNISLWWYANQMFYVQNFTINVANNVVLLAK